MSSCGGVVTLADAAGFMFDLDGTLVARAPEGLVALPGAAAVLAAVRASGRPLVIFTNASDSDPASIAAHLRGGGLEASEREVLSAACSALAHLARRHSGARVLVLGTPAARARFAAAGVELVDEREARGAEVVLTLHVDEVSLAVLEGAAHAVLGGAAFLTANYVRAYAGRHGPILSRGAMVAAAIAKASGRRPTVVGKPSPAAVRAVAERLALDPRRVAFVGDDVAMDIALGRRAGGQTVLVRSGMSAGEPVGERAADLVVDAVADLLPLL
jgi:5'-nucleotidase